MELFEKKDIFAKCSTFNNLYNARVELNEAVICCRLFLGLQSPTLNLLVLIQNRKFCKNVLTSCGLFGHGHEN